MLVKLTVLPAKTELYVRADLIMLVERNRQNPLETLVTTSIMSPKGPFTYAVCEPPDEVARLMAKAVFEGAKENKILFDS